MNTIESRNIVQSIIELRRRNPELTFNDIYRLTRVNRNLINVWTKGAFGVNVAEYVKCVLSGKPLLPLKHFKVKHYVELTENGIATVMEAIGRSLGLTYSGAVMYGAVNDNSMLCVEIGGGYTGSRLVYTNYVLSDPTLYRAVPYTTPGILLGIQNRNLGLEY